MERFNGRHVELFEACIVHELIIPPSSGSRVFIRLLLLLSSLGIRALNGFDKTHTFFLIFEISHSLMPSRYSVHYNSCRPHQSIVVASGGISMLLSPDSIFASGIRLKHSVQEGNRSVRSSLARPHRCKSTVAL
jgi:hypothetical protein